MLKQELLEIVQAEKESQKRLDDHIVLLQKESMKLQEELYRNLKDHKNALQDKHRAELALLQESLKEEAVTNLAKERSKIEQSYHYTVEQKEAMIKRVLKAFLQQK